MTDAPPAAAPGAATPDPGPPASTDPQARPAHGRSSRRRQLLWVVVGLAIVAAVVVVLAPLASPDPDGLESVAGQQGWLDSARSAVFDVLPGYTIPGLDGSAGTVVAGLLGVGIVFLAMLGLGWVLRRRRPSDAPPR